MAKRENEAYKPRNGVAPKVSPSNDDYCDSGTKDAELARAAGSLYRNAAANRGTGGDKGIQNR